MSEGTLQIQSENILPIIKKWLYTDKEIFLRELISNSCDAIHKAQALEGDSTSSYRIHVTTDAKANTLTITDNGIGMTREEVEKYIAQVAFSGAKEFVEKYQNEEKSGGIIGHFGLGFYSAFMPSSLVTIDTLSKQAENAPTFWSCDGSATYTIETGTRRDPGTSITLHIAEDSKEFLEPSRLREILAKYCRFLPIPIDLNGSQINEQEALWTKSSKECTTKDLSLIHI